MTWRSFDPPLSPLLSRESRLFGHFLLAHSLAHSLLVARDVTVRCCHLLSLFCQDFPSSRIPRSIYPLRPTAVCTLHSVVSVWRSLPSFFAQRHISAKMEWINDKSGFLRILLLLPSADCRAWIFSPSVIRTRSSRVFSFPPLHSKSSHFSSVVPRSPMK